MPPWKKAYPTEKVRALVGMMTLGFNTIVSERDIAGQIQASGSYRDLGRRLIQVYALSADLDDFVAQLERELG